jgi:phosphate starvation-inducible PhoH-like protein
VEATTVEHRLDAEGADYLLLAGVNDANLQELARLSGCRVILRGDHLILSGEVADVERAVPVAERLIQQTRMSRPFGVDDIHRAFDAGLTRAEVTPGVQRTEESPVLLAGLKKLIASKSEGQSVYLDAITNHDIVVAIGPAGTGKTYLAVAAAVDALRKNRVKRIILARPAVEAGENLGFLPGDLQEKVDPYLRPLYDALQDIMPGTGYGGRWRRARSRSRRWPTCAVERWRTRS